MITIDNQEVKDLTIDGTPVNEVTMDGVVVWSRSSGQVWKRRIMVGDNLSSGTTLYYDWNLIASQMSNYTGNVDYEPVLTPEGLLFYMDLNGVKDEPWEGPPFIIYSDDNVVWQGWSDSEEDIIENIDSITLTNNYNNVQIPKPNNPMYRRTYIEDPNIRPIEVGDNLSGATLYFTFPDDFYTQFAQYSGYYVVSMGTSVDDDAGSIKLGHYVTYGGPAQIRFVRNNYTGIDIYETNDGATSVLTNISKLVVPIESNLIVLDVLKNNPAYNHILVDTTTLGS